MQDGATTKESYAEAGDVELKSIVVSFYTVKIPVFFITAESLRAVGSPEFTLGLPIDGDFGIDPEILGDAHAQAALDSTPQQALVMLEEVCVVVDGTGICPGLELRALRRSRLPSRTCPSSMADVNESA
jgi:hypothetical protein